MPYTAGESMNHPSGHERMKCYIINGLLPSPHPYLREESDDGIVEHEITFSRHTKETHAQRANRYEQAGMAVPPLGETIFLDAESVGTISVFVFGIYEALFLIKALSQRNAYVLANALRSFLVVAYGVSRPEDQPGYYLLELELPPEPSMSMLDLVALVRPIPPSQPLRRDWLALELTRGPIISHSQIKEACKVIAAGLDHPRLLEAVKHLEHSYSLFWGYMTGSYYDAHYSRERAESTEYELEKLYLEHQVEFDLAFLSAFRGLESILGTPFLRKHEIRTRLAALDSEYRTSFETETYECFHLIFSSHPKRWRYEAIIDHFLVLRNTVAAHANIGSPWKIMEDQVYEIQRLVENLLSTMLDAVTERPL